MKAQFKNPKRVLRKLLRIIQARNGKKYLLDSKIPVRISAVDGCVYITSDLGINSRITVACDANVTREGAVVTTKADLLSFLAYAADGGTIESTSDIGLLTIHDLCGGVVRPYNSASTNPIYPPLLKGSSSEVPSNELEKALRVALRLGFAFGPDVLDRPDLSGSWEEIWRSLESVGFFDLDKVVEYALLLGNATTGAKVGFFLEQHREPLMVEDRHLKALHDMCPRQPHYWDRSRRKSGRLVSEWNLVVPREVLERAWGDVL